ncbi:MAG: aldehyde dehydrogenase family protein, partial [Pseudomonadota bacterium]
MFETKLIVNGNHIDAQAQRVFERECAVGDGIATVSAAADLPDARAAANAAAAAFPQWSQTDDSARATVLRDAAQALLA